MEPEKICAGCKKSLPLGEYRLKFLSEVIADDYCRECKPLPEKAMLFDDWKRDKNRKTGRRNVTTAD